jgi:hydroxymethylpyrimidine/phosphomethylpyrimidine kinase
LPVAVHEGKAFVTEAIRHALPLGDGIGPVDQLWSIDPRADPAG